MLCLCSVILCLKLRYGVPIWPCKCASIDGIYAVCKSTCRDLHGGAAGARDPFSLGNKIRLTLTKTVPGGQFRRYALSYLVI